MPCAEKGGLLLTGNRGGWVRILGPGETMLAVATLMAIWEHVLARHFLA